MRVVILDNYDSFTWNLFQLVAGLTGAEPVVLRNDETSVAGLRDIDPTHLVISPGPGRPEDPAWFGVCREVILELGPNVPILGVCLGHLGIVEAHGGRVVRAPAPRHGKTSPVRHAGRSVFAGLPDPVECMRYHSLVVERTSLPACFELTAWTDDGLVMGVRHRELPLVGVQFHPESVGTAVGPDMVTRFLSDGR